MGRDISTAKHLRCFFEGKILASFCAQDVRTYIACRQDSVKDATINRELCLLSTALNYGKRELEWDIPNPVLGRKLKQPEGRVRWITKPEASSLLRAAEPWSYLVDFITLALHTGCRKQELLGLEWKRVDLQRNLFFLEAEHTKGARRRSVPLNRTARSALMSRMCFRSEQCPGSAWVFAHKNGKRITDVKKSFKTSIRIAGITDFRIHDLRHTCAAWLVTEGVALAEVRDLLGHRSVTMTEKYAHLAPENVRAAVAMLDGSHDLVTVDQIATEVA